MRTYTAEQVLERLQEMHGHALTVAERAELFGMVSNYAALLRERESDVPEGMAATKLKPPLPKSFLGTEDFCFCDNLVSLQGISGNGAPEGYLGSVRLKVNGKFVTYVRERESAKAAVTEEMICRADVAQREFFESTPFTGDSDRLTHESVRAALEAVAPMLASARVPDGWRQTLLECISVLDISTGDTDPNTSDEEMRDEYPEVWVMQKLSELLAAALKSKTEG